MDFLERLAAAPLSCTSDGGGGVSRTAISFRFGVAAVVDAISVVNPSRWLSQFLFTFSCPEESLSVPSAYLDLRKVTVDRVSSQFYSAAKVVNYPDLTEVRVCGFCSFIADSSVFNPLFAYEYVFPNFAYKWHE